MISPATGLASAARPSSVRERRLQRDHCFPDQFEPSGQSVASRFLPGICDAHQFWNGVGADNRTGRKLQSGDGSRPRYNTPPRAMKVPRRAAARKLGIIFTGQSTGGANWGTGMLYTATEPASYQLNILDGRMPQARCWARMAPAIRPAACRRSSDR